MEGSLSNVVRPQPEWGAPSNATRRRGGPGGPQDSDEPAIIMNMADYRAWQAAAPRARPGSAGDGGRRAISAGTCLSNRGVYTAFTLPPNAPFKSMAELKARKGVKGGLKDPSVAFAWESCNDEVSAYLAGSVGQGCPSISGGIELAVSGLAAGRPVIGVEGSLLASINICSCPPLLLPDAVVPFCPTLSLSIRAALENAALAEARTCQMGTFPGGNLRMSGDLGLTIGWGVSVAFYASARMYFGFKCASQQPRGSRLKIGHRYEVLCPFRPNQTAAWSRARVCACPCSVPSYYFSGAHIARLQHFCPSRCPFFMSLQAVTFPSLRSSLASSPHYHLACSLSPFSHHPSSPCSLSAPFKRFACFCSLRSRSRATSSGTARRGRCPSSQPTRPAAPPRPMSSRATPSMSSSRPPLSTPSPSSTSAPTAPRPSRPRVVCSGPQGAPCAGSLE
jgi:hypothetical protein